MSQINNDESELFMVLSEHLESINQEIENVLENIGEHQQQTMTLIRDIELMEKLKEIELQRELFIFQMALDYLKR